MHDNYFFVVAIIRFCGFGTYPLAINNYNNITYLLFNLYPIVS